ncbi:MAG TPA: SRPBCC domain-containing protein [Candidatus Eisenbacteria bacterium]|nr:SRPBCC domain-containing protein [Candidatus Eisenbacteria bacterium]
MVQPATIANDLTLTIEQEIRVAAPLDVTFAALLEELGPLHQVADDHPLPMKLEARPGGRWYRDLGSDNGHLWGHVQAIKRPTLLEINGPLFMSYAAVSNLQYRLIAVDGGTLIVFRHTAIGMILEEHRAGVQDGWKYSHDRIRKAAESAARR